MTATEKTGRRDCKRKMLANDRLAERQTDQETGVQNDWQTNKCRHQKVRQARWQEKIKVGRTATDKQAQKRMTGKTAGRHTVLLGWTATDKTGRRDCKRKMRADDRLAERQTDQ
jgi:hypothetical protein